MADGKQYLNAFVNNSATIRDVLATEIEDAPHKAVTWDDNGKLIVPAAKGDPAIGFILSDAFAFYNGITPAGTEVDVLIKDIGLGMASGVIKKGDFVTADTDGKLTKAEDGNFILGVAMTAAESDGELVQVQLTKSGYKGGGSSSSSSSSVKKLADLEDVEGSGAEGNVLTYTSGKWKPQAPAEGVKKLSDLSDVEETDSPTDGYVLKYQTNMWKPAADEKGSEAV